MQARAALPHPPGAYSAMAFLEYAFYPPLYLAGPTVTFNCFCSQRRSPRTIGAVQVSPPQLHHAGVVCVALRRIRCTA